ncbi:hypothetical protein [Micromonospora sp. DH14]|uniref:hypothetical protein n=1 Tax=Micromonospora sp. DH14 TaxID=3040120 RepID=UPI0024432BD7|nr:hypothetical protein [Micromonospora sp. DH14]MDG9678934.1 hypothetical protein [Micromonospora sp. DH14]
MQHGSRRERPELASLAFLGDDSVLREQADRALRETGRGLQAEDCSGADHSGSVRVVVDTRREVSAVTIARDWRSRLGPSGFADALFEAYAAAVQAALEAAALLHLQTQERDPAASDQEPLDRSPDREVDEYTWLRDTWRTLSDLDADLDAAARLTTGTDESSMSSPNGCLTLRIRGGGIIGITGDVRRIARADAGQLQFESRSLFRAFELASAGRTGFVR